MKKIAGCSFVITFIWFGFICAISFMEAPVKFTAPLLSLEAGLDVGRTVFAALNKIEIFFAVISLILLFIDSFNKRIKTVFLFILIILALQTFWLLPSLDERAEIIIGGKTPPDSNIHFYYIILEITKAFSLFFIGLMQINHFKLKSLQENVNKNAAA